MIYRVSHVTSYAYSRGVELGSHLAHLLPRSIPSRQTVLAADLVTDPAISFRQDHDDHFGNRVVWLSIEQAHRSFEVTATSTVAVRAAEMPEADATPPWEAIAATARIGTEGGWRATEFVMPSPLLPASGAARAYASACFAPGLPILAALLALNRQINRDFSFKPGVTTLRTTVGELLGSRQGVCQDFTHLMIACLRGHGVPARYVSGYIRTRAPAGMPRRVGADVSHAWVGAWLGPVHGWIGLDPTNDLIVGEEHVVLGWGRDFSDISPLFGIILGGGRHTLKVAVDLQPEDQD